MSVKSLIGGFAAGRMRRSAVLVAVTGLILIADRWLKLLAIERLRETPPADFLGGFVRISYQENAGAMLSIGADLPPSIRFLFLTAFVALLLGGLLLYVLAKRSVRPLDVIAASLVLGGGIGNVIDRLLYNGVVIDYITIGWESLRTGVFNLADTAILAGAALFIFGRRDAVKQG